MPTLRRAGYTLIEIVVALVVLATGALGLAAGSAVVAREISADGVRSQAARVAASRREKTEASCRVAQSGSEMLGAVSSIWTVSRPDSVRLIVAGTVSYSSPRGIRSEPYSAAIRCL